MYLSPETFERDNPDYRRIERKPWNVRIGDVILLEDLTKWPTYYIPVEITTIWTSKTRLTEWTFLHKPVNPNDKGYLYNWWQTRWDSLNTVEVYRKGQTS